MADFLEKLYLKYSSRLSGLRRVPGLRQVTHRVSHWALPPERLVWVQVRKGLGEGLWLSLRPRTGQDYCEGRVETSLQKVLNDFLRPGMVFYDLGANLGFFSLLAARMVGTDGRVFSFEADPEVAQRLRQNVERNRFRHVLVVNRAVWSSTGSVAFSRADETMTPERGDGRVVTSPTPAIRTIEVPCTTLDDFARTGVPPDFIKCDVEGAEWEVFRGAREVISKHRPLVACEVHSDQNAAQLMHFFGGLNYALNWFTPKHFLASPQRGADPSSAVAANLVDSV